MCGAPAFPVRSEDAERIIRVAGRDVLRGDDRDPRERAHRDALFLGYALESALPSLGEGAHVLAQMDATRPGLDRDPDRLRDAVPAADDQGAAAGGERAPEVSE